jgi:hypothetical protein
MDAFTFKLEESLSLAIRYLHQHQYPNGEFCCYLGHEDAMKDTIPDSNVFPTSLIAYALLNLQHIKEVEEMLNRAAAFLQFQSMRGGVWNNFTSWHPYFPICPADVDNTACASKVLQALYKEFPDNEEILLANRSKNGLFYTWYALRPNKVRIKNYWLLLLRELKYPIKSMMFWLKNACNRNDIDAAVNANVLFYLGLRPSTKPIISYLLDIIEKNKEADCDKWYRHPFSIYYFISRNYAAGILDLEPVRESIIDRVLSTARQNGQLGKSILDTAWGMISLIHLKCDPSKLQKSADYLLSQQGVYGEWPRWAVYYGGPDKSITYGSEEMTTAFCIEALSCFKQQVKL